MAYLDDVEKELRRRLANHPCLNEAGQPQYEDWEEEITAFVAEKIKESFKNGAATERKRSQNVNRKPNKKSKASK